MMNAWSLRGRVCRASRWPSARTRKAAALAKDRVQSRLVDGSLPGSGPIIHHPDVKRMLMTMRAFTEGCRAMAITAAAGLRCVAPPPRMPTCASRTRPFYEYMVPLVKGYSTEMSVEVASLGVQVHGGMGFIEETGAAQYLRDARILPIYEGTTAIQANDLVGRKTARDGGQRQASAGAGVDQRPALDASAAPAAMSPAASPSPQSVRGR